jgi:hypothetical protein
MTDTPPPPIPHALSHLPVAGGLPVPWITPQVDGRYLFGAIDADRRDQALLQRRCGVCAEPLGARLVLLLRASDLSRRRTAEPALDPACAAFTARMCPMVAGRLDHYRATARTLDPAMIPGPDAAARRGARAEPWFAVWLPAYAVIADHGGLAASYPPGAPLRIRPIHPAPLGHP